MLYGGINAAATIRLSEFKKLKVAQACKQIDVKIPLTKV